MGNKLPSPATIARLVCLAAALVATPAFSQYVWEPFTALNSDAISDNTAASIQRNDSYLDLARSDNGTIVAVWVKGSGVSEGPQNIIKVARSTDSGRTWSNIIFLGGFPHHAFYNYQLNPMVISTGPGQWFIWTRTGYSSYSTDDGQTWSIPTAFDTRVWAIGSNGAGMMMKTSLPTGSNPTPVMQSLDGGITWSLLSTIPLSVSFHVVHSGGSSWFIAGGRESPGAYTYTFHTEDNGLTWEELAPTENLSQMADFTSDHQGTMMAIATAGMAHGMWSSNPRSETFSRTSYDNGRTWYTNSIESADLYQVFHRHVANVEWVGENRYIAAWSRNVAEPFSFLVYDTSRIFTAYTEDAGQTWSAPVELTPDASAPVGVGYVRPKIAGNFNNVVVGWHSEVSNGTSDPVYGPDSDIFYSVGFDEPIAPPPPPPPPPVVHPTGPNLTGSWAPATAKYRISKNGKFKGSIKAVFLAGNNGTQKIDKKSTVRFYLSSDPVLDLDDVELKQKKVGKLKPGKGKSLKVKLNKLPAPVTGQYLFAVVDADMTVPESNEADNIILSEPLP